jgi:hypothetical protein
MARHKLRDSQVKAAGKGIYGDGDGLFLRVSPTGARSWVFIWRRHGRRHEMGLGGYNLVSLAAARDKAAEARGILGRGGDPFTEMAERQASLKRTTRRVRGRPHCVRGIGLEERATVTERWRATRRRCCESTRPMRSRCSANVTPPMARASLALPTPTCLLKVHGSATQ